MSGRPRSAEALNVFYSYSHKDEELRDALETHLALLKRQGVISTWHDRRIGAGTEWAGEIDVHLKEADIILLLISADFLASDYCYDVELGFAMRMHEDVMARVIPVILRPCDMTDAPFRKLQSLPRDAVPVTKWPNRDDAFKDIADGIRRAAGELPGLRMLAFSGTKYTGPPGVPRPPVVGFVARRDEQGRDIVERLGGELSPGKNQLAALWGPGGTGKTTLAAEVVRATAEVFKGRVAWVSALGRAEFNLATLLDETATQLGREDLRKLAPEQKAAQVGALVGSQPTLVVLDNFETIAEEEQDRCLDFLTHHAACPALITTRSRVNRDDVSNVPLAAMSLEEARDFLQRLVERTRKPSNFDELDPGELIQKCEANPLVLQWVVRQIDLSKRPRDVLNDLAHGEGDAAERVFTRSFNLPQVGDDGRAALLALSLFTPHASREALAEVSGFGDDVRRLNEAVEGLSSLWLVETTDGNERLFLRGLTRELAKSRLSRSESADTFKQRYVACFLRHAKTHKQSVPEGMDALEAEKENLLGASDVAFGLRDWASVMGIRDAINGFLDLRGHWAEAVRSGEQAKVAAHEANDDDFIAYFMTCIAGIHLARREYEDARRGYAEALEFYRVLESERNIAVCLHNLATIAQGQQSFDEARKLYNECLEIKKRLGNQSIVASTLHNLAMLAQEQGEVEEASRLYGESLEIKKQAGDLNGVAHTLNELGRLAQNQGKTEDARRLYGESLEINKTVGNQLVVAIAFYNLALLAETEGNQPEARRHFHAALNIFEKLGMLAYADDARRDLERLEAGSV